jgi:hypothetical protein
VEFAPAIYKWLSITDAYDHLEKLGVENPGQVITSGGSSSGYASKYNTFGLIVEMPYFDEPRVNDKSVTTTTRRDALKSLLAGSAGAAAGSSAAAQARSKAAPNCAAPAYGDWSHLQWGKGFEGQRVADLGDGTYLNPVFSGDRPDPTILKDGDDYWMTFSSFDSYPGIVVWHSTDLVHWAPVGPALTTPVGSVWACDIARHGDRYFIYFPARTAERRTNYVVHAASMRGPSSPAVSVRRLMSLSTCVPDVRLKKSNMFYGFPRLISEKGSTRAF